MSEEPTEIQLEPEVGPRHELPKVRIPSWLQQKFDELDKEAATQEHEEEPEPKTPEQTLNEIYSELPVPPPTRFLQTALRRDHPDLGEQEIDEIIEETRPPEPNRLIRIYGFS